MLRTDKNIVFLLDLNVLIILCRQPDNYTVIKLRVKHVRYVEKLIVFIFTVTVRLTV